MFMGANLGPQSPAYLGSNTTAPWLLTDGPDHRISPTPWRNGSASDSRSEGCVFKSRRGHGYLYDFFHQRPRAGIASQTRITGG